MTRVFKAYEETLSLRDLARAPDPEPAATAGQNVKSAPVLRSRVFVIDDEEGICKFVSAAASSMDYEADHFTSAPLALRALKHCYPAVSRPPSYTEPATTWCR
jgi:hypothetical protein